VNSIVIVNWEDKDVAERIAYSLEKQGFKRTEDYESTGTRIQVWEKEAKDNARGRVLNASPLDPIKLLPPDMMVQAILPRLENAIGHLPGQTPLWTEHLALNLVYDLMGKPG
jgi:hypothetical protein